MRARQARFISSYLHADFSRGGYRGRTPRLGSGSATPQRGGSTPRRGMSRGRGRGGSDTPRARLGFGDNRNRNARETFRLDVPLSKLLNSERPYLKPVIFVPSVYTKTLFEEVEDLLQPVAESAGPWIFSFDVNALKYLLLSN